MIAIMSPTHTLEWIVNGLQGGGEASGLESRATRALRNILLVDARVDEKVPNSNASGELSRY